MMHLGNIDVMYGITVYKYILLFQATKWNETDYFLVHNKTLPIPKVTFASNIQN